MESKWQKLRFHYKLDWWPIQGDSASRPLTVGDKHQDKGAGRWMDGCTQQLEHVKFNGA